ncbi:MAG: alpha/beta fold hydrolase [Pseudomonadales bacterium]|nr:alpha/beta fold hydrolase [Pseudomonadales bacterium]
MMQLSQQALKTTRVATQNARDWLSLADHLIQAERTPFDVIHQIDIARLRYYPPLQESQIKLGNSRVNVAKQRFESPLVIVAPLAVNMFIYDMFPERSLVRYLNARGFEVYMVDWGSPGWRQNHHHLSTYFAELLPEMIQQVRSHSGKQQLSLHGWSFGGLFSYCYTALYNDKDIKNIALIGAPNDYHANGEIGKLYQGLSKQLRWIEKRTGWKVHDSKRRYWRSPGWGNSLGFKLTNPINSVQGYWDLIRNLNDRDYVSSHATNAAFLDRMEAYPGGVVQDFVHHLWNKNLLAHGKLPMDSEPEVLANIESSIFSVVGRQDPIVTPECSHRLLEQISSQDITRITVNGGHMGILGGSKAPENSWFKLADWLATRS